MSIILTLAILSLIIWLFLLIFWGQFWRIQPELESTNKFNQPLPKVCVIIPARNEEKVIAESLTSVLQQNYRDRFSVILVDDNSNDSTATIAKKISRENNKENRLHIISGKTLPSQWKGKLWAIQQGIEYTKINNSIPDYFLFTDADIKHPQDNLIKLVSKAETEKLDLVSLMVKLRCQSFWEKLLIPAFVFFFQKLYPFSLVNKPKNKIAAAAGGCILIRPQALETIGGIPSIKNALIDDCTLAKKIKSANFNIWLGLSQTTNSIRPYHSLNTIWQMVSRTAFCQLNYSLVMLVLAIIGMIIIYLIPIITIPFALFDRNWLLLSIGLSSWLLMSLAYFPTIEFYKISPFWTFCLPPIALLYTLMTINSGIKYWSGKGGSWKGRIDR